MSAFQARQNVQADGKATRSQAVSYSYVIPIRELALPSKSSCNNIGIEFLVLHASVDSETKLFILQVFAILKAFLVLQSGTNTAIPTE